MNIPLGTLFKLNATDACDRPLIVHAVVRGYISAPGGDLLGFVLEMVDGPADGSLIHLSLGQCDFSAAEP